MLFSGSDVDLRASEVVFGRLFHFFGSLLAWAHSRLAPAF